MYLVSDYKFSVTDRSMSTNSLNAIVVLHYLHICLNLSAVMSLDTDGGRIQG